MKRRLKALGGGFADVGLFLAAGGVICAVGVFYITRHCVAVIRRRGKGKGKDKDKAGK